MNQNKNWIHCHRHRLCRFVAIVTLFVFSTSEVGRAFPASNLPIETTQSSSWAMPEEFTIPENLGRMEAFYREPSGKQPFIILIQDAHAVIDAQQKIRGLIDYLRNEYGIFLVALEGAEGHLDSVLFQTFPDPAVKEKVFTEYLRRGEITGAGLAAISGETSNRFFGIENWNLYEANYFSYLKTNQRREQLNGILKNLLKDFDSKRRQIFSKELNQFHEEIRKFHQNEIHLLDLFKYLKNSKLMITPEIKNHLEQQYPQVAALWRAVILEETKEMQNLNASIRALAQQFAQERLAGASPEKQKEFNGIYQSFLAGERDDGTFLKYLTETAQALGREPDLTPAMKELLQHSQVLAAIRGSRFHEELSAFLDEIESGLIQTPEQQTLRDHYRKILFLEDLTALELTRKEWDEYRLNPEASLSLLGDSRDVIASALQFYDIALERDLAFQKNLSGLLQKEKESAAIFVAGGFHTRGMEQEIKKAGYSYAVITPSVENLAGQENYQNLMQGGLSYKEYLKTSFYDAFARHASRALASESEGLALKINLKHWRDEIIRRLADEKRITQSGSYTRYIDELFESFQAPSKQNGFENQPSQNAIDNLKKELDQFRDQALGKLSRRFKSQLENFVSGLKDLSKKSELSQESVEALAQKTVTNAPEALSQIANLVLSSSQMAPRLRQVILNPAEIPDIQIEYAAAPQLPALKTTDDIQTVLGDMAQGPAGMDLSQDPQVQALTQKLREEGKLGDLVVGTELKTDMTLVQREVAGEIEKIADSLPSEVSKPQLMAEIARAIQKNSRDLTEQSLVPSKTQELEARIARIENALGLDSKPPIVQPEIVKSTESQSLPRPAAVTVGLSAEAVRADWSLDASKSPLEPDVHRSETRDESSEAQKETIRRLLLNIEDEEYDYLYGELIEVGLNQSHAGQILDAVQKIDFLLTPNLKQSLSLQEALIGIPLNERTYGMQRLGELQQELIIRRGVSWYINQLLRKRPENFNEGLKLLEEILTKDFGIDLTSKRFDDARSHFPAESAAGIESIQPILKEVKTILDLTGPAFERLREKKKETRLEEKLFAFSEPDASQILFQGDFTLKQGQSALRLQPTERIFNWIGAHEVSQGEPVLRFQFYMRKGQLYIQIRDVFYNPKDAQNGKFFQAFTQLVQFAAQHYGAPVILRYRGDEIANYIPSARAQVQKTQSLIKWLWETKVKRRDASIIDRENADKSPKDFLFYETVFEPRYVYRAPWIIKNHKSLSQIYTRDQLNELALALENVSELTGIDFETLITRVQKILEEASAADRAEFSSLIRTQNKTGLTALAVFAAAEKMPAPRTTLTYAAEFKQTIQRVQELGVQMAFYRLQIERYSNNYEKQLEALGDMTALAGLRPVLTPGDKKDDDPVIQQLAMIRQLEERFRSLRSKAAGILRPKEFESKLVPFQNPQEAKLAIDLAFVKARYQGTYNGFERQILNAAASDPVILDHFLSSLTSDIASEILSKPYSFEPKGVHRTAFRHAAASIYRIPGLREKVKETFERFEDSSHVQGLLLHLLYEDEEFLMRVFYDTRLDPNIRLIALGYLATLQGIQITKGRMAQAILKLRAEAEKINPSQSVSDFMAVSGISGALLIQALGVLVSLELAEDLGAGFVPEKNLSRMLSRAVKSGGIWYEPDSDVENANSDYKVGKGYINSYNIRELKTVLAHEAMHNVAYWAIPGFSAAETPRGEEYDTLVAATDELLSYLAEMHYLQKSKGRVTMEDFYWIDSDWDMEDQYELFGSASYSEGHRMAKDVLRTFFEETNAPSETNFRAFLWHLLEELVKQRFNFREQEGHTGQEKFGKLMDLLIREFGAHHDIGEFPKPVIQRPRFTQEVDPDSGPRSESRDGEMSVRRVNPVSFIFGTQLNRKEVLDFPREEADRQKQQQSEATISNIAVIMSRLSGIFQRHNISINPQSQKSLIVPDFESLGRLEAVKNPEFAVISGLVAEGRNEFAVRVLKNLEPGGVMIWVFDPGTIMESDLELTEPMREAGIEALEVGTEKSFESKVIPYLIIKKSGTIRSEQRGEEPPMPWTPSDAFFLTFFLDEALENARRMAVDYGNQDANITVGLELRTEPERSLELVIRDNGPGFDVNQLRLAARFFYEKLYGFDPSKVPPGEREELIPLIQDLQAKHGQWLEAVRRLHAENYQADWQNDFHIFLFKKPPELVLTGRDMKLEETKENIAKLLSELPGTDGKKIVGQNIRSAEADKAVSEMEALAAQSEYKAVQEKILEAARSLKDYAARTQLFLMPTLRGRPPLYAAVKSGIGTYAGRGLTPASELVKAQNIGEVSSKNYQEPESGFELRVRFDARFALYFPHIEDFVEKLVQKKKSASGFENVLQYRYDVIPNEGLGGEDTLRSETRDFEEFFGTHGKEILDFFGIQTGEIENYFHFLTTRPGNSEEFIRFTIAHTLITRDKQEFRFHTKHIITLESLETEEKQVYDAAVEKEMRRTQRAFELDLGPEAFYFSNPKNEERVIVTKNIKGTRLNLEPSMTLDEIRAIAFSLGRLHAAGLIHGDLFFPAIYEDRHKILRPEHIALETMPDGKKVARFIDFGAVGLLIPDNAQGIEMERLGVLDALLRTAKGLHPFELDAGKKLLPSQFDARQFAKDLEQSYQEGFASPPRSEMRNWIRGSLFGLTLSSIALCGAGCALLPPQEPAPAPASLGHFALSPEMTQEKIQAVLSQSHDSSFVAARLLTYFPNILGIKREGLLPAVYARSLGLKEADIEKTLDWMAARTAAGQQPLRIQIVQELNREVRKNLREIEFLPQEHQLDYFLHFILDPYLAMLEHAVVSDPLYAKEMDREIAVRFKPLFADKDNALETFLAGFRGYLKDFRTGEFRVDRNRPARKIYAQEREDLNEALIPFGYKVFIDLRGGISMPILYKITGRVFMDTDKLGFVDLLTKSSVTVNPAYSGVHENGQKGVNVFLEKLADLLESVDFITTEKDNLFSLTPKATQLFNSNAGMDSKHYFEIKNWLMRQEFSQDNRQTRWYKLAENTAVHELKHRRDAQLGMDQEELHGEVEPSAYLTAYALSHSPYYSLLKWLEHLEPLYLNAVEHLAPNDPTRQKFEKDFLSALTTAQKLFAGQMTIEESKRLARSWYAERKVHHPGLSSMDEFKPAIDELHQKLPVVLPRSEIRSVMNRWILPLALSFVATFGPSLMSTAQEPVRPLEQQVQAAKKPEAAAVSRRPDPSLIAARMLIHFSNLLNAKPGQLPIDQLARSFDVTEEEMQSAVDLFFKKIAETEPLTRGRIALSFMEDLKAVVVQNLNTLESLPKKEQSDYFLHQVLDPYLAILEHAVQTGNFLYPGEEQQKELDSRISAQFAALFGDEDKIFEKFLAKFRGFDINLETKELFPILDQDAPIIEVDTVEQIKQKLAAQDYAIFIEEANDMLFTIFYKVEGRLSVKQQGVGDIRFIRKSSLSLSPQWHGISILTGDGVDVSLDTIEENTERIEMIVDQGKKVFGLTPASRRILSRAGVDPDRYLELSTWFFGREFPGKDRDQRLQLLAEQTSIHESKHKWDEKLGFIKSSLHREASAYFAMTVFDSTPYYSFGEWLNYVGNLYMKAQGDLEKDHPLRLWIESEFASAWEAAEKIYAGEMDEGEIHEWAKSQYAHLQSQHLKDGKSELPDLDSFKPVVKEIKEKLPKVKTLSRPSPRSEMREDKGRKPLLSSAERHYGFMKKTFGHSVRAALLIGLISMNGESPLNSEMPYYQMTEIAPDARLTLDLAQRNTAPALVAVRIVTNLPEMLYSSDIYNEENVRRISDRMNLEPQVILEALRYIEQKTGDVKGVSIEKWVETLFATREAMASDLKEVIELNLSTLESLEGEARREYFVQSVMDPYLALLELSGFMFIREYALDLDSKVIPLFESLFEDNEHQFKQAVLFARFLQEGKIPGTFTAFEGSTEKAFASHREVNRLLAQFGYYVHFSFDHFVLYRVEKRIAIDQWGLAGVTFLRRIGTAPIENMGGFSERREPDVYILPDTVEREVRYAGLVLNYPFLTPVPSNAQALGIDTAIYGLIIQTLFDRDLTGRSERERTALVNESNALHELNHKLNELGRKDREMPLYANELAAYYASIALSRSPFYGLENLLSYGIKNQTDFEQKIAPEDPVYEFLKSQTQNAWLMVVANYEKKIPAEELRSWAQKNYEQLRLIYDWLPTIEAQQPLAEKLAPALSLPPRSETRKDDAEPEFLKYRSFFQPPQTVFQEAENRDEAVALLAARLGEAREQFHQNYPEWAYEKFDYLKDFTGAETMGFVWLDGSKIQFSVHPRIDRYTHEDWGQKVFFLGHDLLWKQPVVQSKGHGVVFRFIVRFDATRRPIFAAISPYGKLENGIKTEWLEVPDLEQEESYLRATKLTYLALKEMWKTDFPEKSLEDFHTMLQDMPLEIKSEDILTRVDSKARQTLLDYRKRLGKAPKQFLSLADVAQVHDLYFEKRSEMREESQANQTPLAFEEAESPEALIPLLSRQLTAMRDIDRGLPRHLYEDDDKAFSPAEVLGFIWIQDAKLQLALSPRHTYRLNPAGEKIYYVTHHIRLLQDQRLRAAQGLMIRLIFSFDQDNQLTSLYLAPETIYKYGERKHASTEAKHKGFFDASQWVYAALAQIPRAQEQVLDSVSLTVTPAAVISEKDHWMYTALKNFERENQIKNSKWTIGHMKNLEKLYRRGPGTLPDARSEERDDDDLIVPIPVIQSAPTMEAAAAMADRILEARAAHLENHPHWKDARQYPNDDQRAWVIGYAGVSDSGIQFTIHPRLEKFRNKTTDNEEIAFLEHKDLWKHPETRALMSGIFAALEMNFNAQGNIFELSVAPYGGLLQEEWTPLTETQQEEIYLRMNKLVFMTLLELERKKVKVQPDVNIDDAKIQEKIGLVRTDVSPEAVFIYPGTEGYSLLKQYMEQHHILKGKPWRLSDIMALHDSYFQRSESRSKDSSELVFHPRFQHLMGLKNILVEEGVYPRDLEEETHPLSLEQSLDFAERGVFYEIQKSKDKFHGKESVRALGIGTGTGMDAMTAIYQLFEIREVKSLQMDLIDITRKAVGNTVENIKRQLTTLQIPFTLHESASWKEFDLADRGVIRVIQVKEGEEFDYYDQIAPENRKPYDFAFWNSSIPVPDIESEDIVDLEYLAQYETSAMSMQAYDHIVNHVMDYMAPQGVLIMEDSASSDEELSEKFGKALEVVVLQEDSMRHVYRITKSGDLRRSESREQDTKEDVSVLRRKVFEKLTGMDTIVFFEKVYPRWTNEQIDSISIGQTITFIDSVLLPELRLQEKRFKQLKTIHALGIGSGSGLDGLTAIYQLLAVQKIPRLELDLIDISENAVANTVENLKRQMRRLKNLGIINRWKFNVVNGITQFDLGERGIVRVSLVESGKEFAYRNEINPQPFYDFIFFNAPSVELGVDRIEQYGEEANVLAVVMSRTAFAQILERFRSVLAPNGVAIIEEVNTPEMDQFIRENTLLPHETRLLQEGYSAMLYRILNPAKPRSESRNEPGRISLKPILSAKPELSVFTVIEPALQILEKLLNSGQVDEEVLNQWQKEAEPLVARAIENIRGEMNTLDFTLAAAQMAKQAEAGLEEFLRGLFKIWIDRGYIQNEQISDLSHRVHGILTGAFERTAEQLAFEALGFEPWFFEALSQKLDQISMEGVEPMNLVVPVRSRNLPEAVAEGLKRSSADFTDLKFLFDPSVTALNRDLRQSGLVFTTATFRGLDDLAGAIAKLRGKSGVYGAAPSFAFHEGLPDSLKLNLGLDAIITDISQLPQNQKELQMILIRVAVKILRLLKAEQVRNAAEPTALLRHYLDQAGLGFFMDFFALSQGGGLQADMEGLVQAMKTLQETLRAA